MPPKPPPRISTRQAVERALSELDMMRDGVDVPSCRFDAAWRDFVSGLRPRRAGPRDGIRWGPRPGERPAGQAATPGGRGSPGDRRRRRIGDGRAVLRLARAAPRLRPGGAVRLRLRAVGRPQALPDTGALGPRRLPAQHLCPGGRYPLRGRAERADVALPGAPPGALPGGPRAR